VSAEVPLAVRPWWRDGVIYQIYPWSFADGNGDGIGDLMGIAERLDHAVGLGVDAVWLGPIYPNGRVDWGYDVIDYRDVDPVFGGMEAFDRLLEAAHGKGLRVLLDFVPNHTSNRHPWFIESSSSRHSPKRGWYVWADGRIGQDGSRLPPNNWESSFGDSAWQWHEPTQQWYLASFYPEQCDLNWANPAVRAEVVGSMRSWVERGVDGFRIDVVHRLAKDPRLRDNPQPARLDRVGRVRRPSMYDENQPEVHEYLREMRSALSDRILLLGEVWLIDQDLVFEYLGPGELDLAFNFSLATASWNAREMAGEIAEAERRFPSTGWPCYHLSNHDEPRAGTRFGERAIRAAAVLLLTLRGTPVLYQGEEIGMVDGRVPLDRRRDAFGRDGCRTPMQWDAGPKAGFCPPGVEPWLPVAQGFEQRNVQVESNDPDSVLALYRRLLSARRTSPALRRGDYGELSVSDQALVFSRETKHEGFAVAINFTSRSTRVAAPAGIVEIATAVRREGEEVGGRLVLGPDEAVVIRVHRPVA
jgi:alpha-glucosidase